MATPQDNRAPEAPEASGPDWEAILGATLPVVGQFMANKQQQGATAAGNVKNRVFQQHMRNTQWQAGVEDMRKAGLNPALAYQQGPASAPSGSNAGVMGNLAAGVLSSAQQYARFGREMRLLGAQTHQAQSTGNRQQVEADRLSPRGTLGNLANRGITQLFNSGDDIRKGLGYMKYEASNWWRRQRNRGLGASQGVQNSPFGMSIQATGAEAERIRRGG